MYYGISIQKDKKPWSLYNEDGRRASFAARGWLVETSWRGFWRGFFGGVSLEGLFFFFFRFHGSLEGLCNCNCNLHRGVLMYIRIRYAYSIQHTADVMGGGVHDICLMCAASCLHLHAGSLANAMLHAGRHQPELGPGKVLRPRISPMASGCHRGRH